MTNDEKIDLILEGVLKTYELVGALQLAVLAIVDGLAEKERTRLHDLEDSVAEQLAGTEPRRI